MSTRVFAYWETLTGSAWELLEAVSAEEEFGHALVPHNAAPSSWGSYNFRIYYHASGERDLPDDLSAELRTFIQKHWDYVNRPSWMSLAEIVAFYEQDADHRYAHIPFEHLLTDGAVPPPPIRLVFWADQ